MKKLFENFRAHIKEKEELEEAANLDFKKYALIPIEIHKQDHVLVLLDIEKWMSSLKQIKQDADHGEVEVGELQIALIEEIIRGVIFVEPSRNVTKGKCFSVGGKPPWEIVSSAAVDKLGPMLYDYALQFVKRKGGPGVVSDRNTVSRFAAGIYEKWMETGHGATGIKIVAAKMDDEDNPETPPEEDDCPLTPPYDVGEPVNFVYSTPKIGREFSVAMSRGRQLIDVAVKEYGIRYEYLDDALEMEAIEFFSEEYKKV